MFAFFKNLWWLVTNTLPVTPISGAENGLHTNSDGSKAMLGGDIKEDTSLHVISGNTLIFMGDVLSRPREVHVQSNITVDSTSTGVLYWADANPGYELFLPPSMQVEGLEILVQSIGSGVIIPNMIDNSHRIIYKGKAWRKIMPTGLYSYCKLKYINGNYVVIESNNDWETSL